MYADIGICFFLLWNGSSKLKANLAFVYVKWVIVIGLVSCIMYVSNMAVM